MTSIRAIVLTLALFCGAAPAMAEQIRYYSDPILPFAGGIEAHPMEDMIALAKSGDVRAQFILGDLYAKGKGGLTRDLKQARHWFETSARNGYYFSFIRLAALDKNNKRPVAAYKWYTLAMETLRGQSRQHAIKARAALVKDAKLSQEETSRARQDARTWKNAAPENDTEKPPAKENVAKKRSNAQ